MYQSIIQSLELNFKPKAKIQYGTPMLSKYGDNLYPSQWILMLIKEIRKLKFY